MALAGSFATSTASWRDTLHDQLSQFSGSLDSAVSAAVLEARERARWELAEELNQAVRRMRQCSTVEEVHAVLVDTAVLFSHRAAVFSIDGGVVRGAILRGAGYEDGSAGFHTLEAPLAEAAAFRSAIESRDPVTAMGTASELSPQVTDFFALEPANRVHLYPIVVRQQVGALLYAAGGVESAPLQLLAEAAALMCHELTPAARRTPPGLVELSAPVRKSPSWADLPGEERRLHIAAQRFARVQVARIRVYRPEDVRAGRTGRDLYTRLREPVDRARAEFRGRFMESCPSMPDYLHLELIHSLAHGDEELLGSHYPGPLL